MSTARKILQLLKSNCQEELSSSAICDVLMISRNAVWKHVQALRDQGYQIEAHSRCGYRLVASPDRPDAAEVLPLLTTAGIGRTLHYKDVTESTNRDAAAGAEAGCEDGTVFCAGEQRGGRGRMDRKWFSPPGVNLYFSMVLRPAVATGDAASLPLVVGIAVASVIDKLVPELEPCLKWPNDILINNRKVCGILCEMQAQIDCGVRYITAGAGINVNSEQSSLPEALQQIATSLKSETGREFSRTELLAQILNEFECRYDIWKSYGFEPLSAIMDKYDALKGRRISVQQGQRTITGEAAGVQADGALKVKTDSGLESVYSGEARIVGY